MNMAFRLDLGRHSGLMMPRRTVLKLQQVRRQRANTGTTASIGKLSENAGTFAAPGRTNLEAAESDQRR
jgi:hypothetical protein